MFPNKHHAYNVPSTCLYQNSYPNYADNELHHVPHVDGSLEAASNQGFQTWSNFFPNNNRMSSFDQLMLMNHTSLSNQFYSDFNNGTFPKGCAAQVPQDCSSNQPGERIQGGEGFEKYDGRRSSESAVAVSSDGIRSCSVSPEMSVNYNNLGGGRASVAKAPQIPRPEFEWMTKTSYQSQPNPGKTRTKDKYRVVYTDKQRLELEKEFHFNRYITIRRKAELAEVLGLSERQVKIWFQNRRAKERKQQKKKDEFNRHQAKEQGIVVCQLNTMGISSPNLLRPLPQFEHQNTNARTIAMY